MFDEGENIREPGEITVVRLTLIQTESTHTIKAEVGGTN